jgi:superfamily II DNA/RNA helicase
MALFFPVTYRELALQIAEQFEALGAGIGVKCVVVSPECCFD